MKININQGIKPIIQVNINLKLIFILFSYIFISFHNKTIIKKSKNIIPIAFSLNNEYIYPLLVALTSILYNANNNTFYNFNIMVPGDFLNLNKILILGLRKKFPNCKIIFHNLKNKYYGWENQKYYSISTYYRLSLSNLIRDYDKIIYMDCDTLTHKDLSEFYNLDMKGNYYLGFPALEIGKLVINGTKNYIGAGVMLVNIKELRKVNAPYLFEAYYKNYGTKKVDEYLINIIFYNKIGFLPYKYGLPDFNNKNLKVRDFWLKYKGNSNGTLEELIKASEDPSITHNSYTLKKWWTKNYKELTKIGKKWIFYAYHSNVFNKICKKYKQLEEICKKIKQDRLEKY